MKFPWSTEKIFCEGETELINLLSWIREQSLAEMNKTTFDVKVSINDSVDAFFDGPKLVGYWVEVPHSWISKRIAKLTPQLAVQDILDPQP